MSDWKEYTPTEDGVSPVDWQERAEVEQWNINGWILVTPKWSKGRTYRYRPSQPDWQEQAIAAGWTPPPEPVDPLVEELREQLGPEFQHLAEYVAREYRAAIAKEAKGELA